MKKKLKKKSYIAIWSAVLAVILVAVIIGNFAAVAWDGALSRLLGTVGETDTGSASGSGVYYTTGFESQEALEAAQRAFTERTTSESIVLLKNNGALPLSGSESISLFGLSSKGLVTVGSGSGSSDLDENCTWENSFKEAGFKVNETLLSFYRNSTHKHGSGSTTRDWTIDEVPLAEYTAEVKASYSGYNDVAIMVVGRTGGENGDLARDMSAFGGTADRNYLSLSREEDELLKSLKSEGFKKVVLVVNSAYPMELGAVDSEEYGVDACVWVGNTGVNGLMAVGKLFRGDYNPSGRTVDTYWYDNMSAPAMQNMGDLTVLDESGNPTNIKYVTYAEGIYVGYRYAETRYADLVMGAENVGDFDYASTVKYPFGYGLSYTNFTWSGFSFTKPDANGNVTASVTVTNTGDRAGKEVVEVYYQAPYTDYDRENGIEKSAVALAAYGKTSELQPGASETVSVSFNIYVMASYAANVDGGAYVLDAGDYYVAAGRNAHDALNNILAYQGYSAADGMTEDGDGSFAGVFRRAELDKTSYATTPGGAQLQNRFEDADLNYYVPGAVNYLTRQNWAMMDNNGLMVGEIDASGNQVLRGNNALIAAFNATGYEASGAPALASRNDPSYNYGEENGVELIDLMGKDYDDPLWDSLLDETKLSEQHTMYGKSGYGNDEISAINKPKTYEYDGPASISNFITGSHAFSFPSETTFASTWNIELLSEFGSLAGCDAINSKTSGWYAPGANTHRTPFDGRNFEYFSEDPVLSGTLCTAEVIGAQSKGVYVYVKHLALNDQETNRMDVCTFANEQAIREIYLKNFEKAVVDGQARGIMTSFNRIGVRNAEGHYNLITEVLRNEWGFKGVSITDYKGVLDSGKVDQFLAAGNDMILSTVKNELSDSKAAWSRTELRRAAHNILYVQANSLAMNGMDHGAEYSAGFAVYKILLIALDVIVGLLIIVKTIDIVKKARLSEAEYAALPGMSKKQKITMWAIIGVLVVAFTIFFFVTLLPLILKATGAVV